MQHDHLAGQAVVDSAAIVEALHTGKRHADGKRIVAVQVEGVAMEMRLDALDAGGNRRRHDAVPRGDRIRARTFKTLCRLTV